MPGENIYDWSTTAASNDTADSAINWREGMARAAVNDSARSMLAAHAKQRDLLTGVKVTGGTANAQTFTSGVGYTVIPTNIRVLLKIGLANTGSATLNMDSIADVGIKNQFGADLVAGDLKANFLAEFVYNGTNWILLYSFLPPPALSDGTIPTVSAGGNPNNIGITTGLNLSALFSGLRLTLKVSDTNTGPTTLNVDGLGAKPVVDQLGNPLIGGELVAGSYADFLYDGTKFVLLAPTINPAFYGSRTTNQSLPADVWTKVALNVEVFDYGSYFDNTVNYRYTPLIVGVYQFIGQGLITGLSGGLQYGGVGIYKNGVITFAQVNGAPTSGMYANVSVLLNMNGTTDYVELFAIGSGAPLVGSAGFQGCRIS